MYTPSKPNDGSKDVLWATNDHFGPQLIVQHPTLHSTMTTYPLTQQELLKRTLATTKGPPTSERYILILTSCHC